MFTENVRDSISEKIEMHHELYPAIPVKDVYWECILAESLKCAFKEIKWISGSHAIGSDISVGETGISCKSGKQKIIYMEDEPVDCLTFSSYRTTSYKTLNEKIEFLSEDHEDVFAFLNCEERNDVFQYTVYTLDADYLDYAELTWYDTYNRNNKLVYKGIGKFLVEIRTTMSDQLWVMVPLEDLKLELRTVIV